MLDTERTAHMKALDKQTSTTPQRRPWEQPTLKAVGTVGEILEGGSGKASILASDSGDIHKPNGQS
jgi:hypothetical protein